MDTSLTAGQLAALIATPEAPLVIDVRRKAAWLDAPDWMRGALRRDPEAVAQWAVELPASRPVVLYCVHGHQVSQGAAASLRAIGRQARFLAEGLEGWRASGGALRRKPAGAGTRWITRERPKIDRIACPWLVARRVDPGAEFLYVPTGQVASIAAERQATPYDVTGAELGHHGSRCSFDAFVDEFGLAPDPAIARLADVVRAADTGRLAEIPEAAGLLAVSQGLSLKFADDHEMLRHGMTLYDALHHWAARDVDPASTWRALAG
jgi:rhodanese-related sulfurtransferase